MSQHHPDIPAEQAHVDHAYRCLERSKQDAWRIRSLTEASTGGTFQARFERNAFDEQLVHRLTELDLGDAALVFGRIDRDGAPPPDADGAGGPDGTGPVETFYIGRLAVADEHREPVVVDWRAPVAEPFYRATGRDPMGLLRRRHFAVDGPRVIGIEDELFGEGHLGVGHDEGLDGDGAGVTHAGTGLRGYGTLLTALAKGRTGQLGDIVATIQAEQDEIIRSPHKGVLVVQGGPGTGKTVVALHRAAYLLYTHRFPLEEQGVLVIGPNRVFLRYIEQVLPSLGEAGVELAVLSDLVHGHAVGAVGIGLATRHDPEPRLALKDDLLKTRHDGFDVLVDFRYVDILDRVFLQRVAGEHPPRSAPPLMQRQHSFGPLRQDRLDGRSCRLGDLVVGCVVDPKVGFHCRPSFLDGELTFDNRS